MIRTALIAYLMGIITCGAFAGFVVFEQGEEQRDELFVLNSEVRDVAGAFKWAVDFSEAKWKDPGGMGPVGKSGMRHVAGLQQNLSPNGVTPRPPIQR
jgi:hypothetical protein